MASERDRIFIELYANWGKGIGEKQLRVWAQAGAKWSDAQIAHGVRACIRDRDRIFEPKGFSEFARYLPELERPTAEFLTYGAGRFEGDWQKATISGLFKAVLFTLGYGDRVPDEILRICRQKGITDADIAAGREACPAGRGVNAWVEDWRLGDKNHE